jgi:phosphatidylserine decarboxylase
VAKSLSEWVATDVRPLRDKPLGWLSQHYFFRDPARPTFSDPAYFFTPADGVILYQITVGPEDPILDIKGKRYSLREALRDNSFDRPALVIGIFMTFFDVHVNRLPYPGRLSYRLVDAIDTFNHPMLDVEESLLDDLRIPAAASDYLHWNQRMVNRIDSSLLGQSYYVVQIADYDVDCITPFDLRQNQPCDQGSRFSSIRYGSQVELVIPVSDRHDFVPVQPVGFHVEAGTDPLVEIRAKGSNR